jgi:hypothetical protein
MPTAVRRHRPRARLLIAAALVILSSGSGCVQRQLTIRSNPPGALVYVGNEQIGVTPCSTPYTYYGVRKIRLVKDGYETLTVEQNIPPPWYERFPLDFVSENVWPAEIRDDRTLSFNLEPQRVVPQGEIIARGENLRSATRADGFVPPGAMIPGPNGSVIVPPGGFAPGCGPMPDCPSGNAPPRMMPFSGE